MTVVNLDGMARGACDRVLAAGGLIILSPLFLALAGAVKLGDPGPVLYRATRVGKDGRLFKLYKFRTMRVGADKAGPGITTKGDSRITPTGKFLRKSKLDELPQLINVLRGEMSLVGPRPEDPRYVARYSDEQRAILRFKPGITSAASLEYRDEEHRLAGQDWESTYISEVMPTKLNIDLRYLQRRTLITDFGLMLRTVAAMFR
jgi:lipopolysaccharide/colanic/teichoic acid biosynthesis glycosyltransferase